MKKIALISTYCDTEEKVNVLIENIEIIKSLGVDTLVISPINLPEIVIKKSDFVFFTNENPILSWPERSFTFWKSFFINGRNIIFHRNVSDYGWAGLYQLKKMCQISLTYDYDLFYHIIYDLDIDDTIKSEIQNNECNFIHRRVSPDNPKETWKSTLHFMAFDRKTIKELVEKITMERYLENNGVAEDQAFEWTKELPIEIKDYPVMDKIFYWKGVDLFNSSKSPGYKLFIGKNETTSVWKGNSDISIPLDSKIKIFFYDFETPETLKITINGSRKEFNIGSNEIFYSEIDSNEEIFCFTIEDSSGVQNYLDIFNGSERTLIYDYI